MFTRINENSLEPVDWAKEVLYNPAGQMTQLKYGYYGYTETRSYNTLGQVTQIRSNYGGVDSLNMQYVYSATQNNGQISQSIDSVSGETIDYTYDSLNRLITSATQGPQWGLSFSYDGFGNRLSQTVTKGSGPNNNLSVKGGTNRIKMSGYSYFPNGNLGIMPYGTGSMTLDTMTSRTGWSKLRTPTGRSAMLMGRITGGYTRRKPMRRSGCFFTELMGIG